MKPAIKKAASSKTMRVATVFTGAACAAAIAPTAAAAGTGLHAVERPGHQARLGTGRPGARPGGTTYGSITRITGLTCNDVPHWTHFFSGHASEPGHSNGVNCFGYAGDWDATSGSSFDAWGICGGNNYGVYGAYSDNGAGQWFIAGFGPGDTLAELPNITSKSDKVLYMAISKWKGNDAC
jgi:hypothetical protein